MTCELALTCFKDVNKFDMTFKLDRESQFAIISFFGEHGNLSYDNIMEWDFARLMEYGDWLNNKLEAAEAKARRDAENGSTTPD